jgi:hypothetical protein
MFFEPTLRVREVAIYRGAHQVYRAKFHSGVNIISGENSSGKSTILSLIVYGLGADINSWSEAAKRCDRVVVEVGLNNSIVTVSRQITTQTGQPMDVFGGTLEEAESAPASSWLRYPYRTSESRESFSQALFHLLNIPELETEASGKLTMHQILRVLYSDQLSSVESIFRDDNFDTPALRDAVGRLLFGAYESDIYSNQIRIRVLEKELAAIESALRSIYTILSGLEHSLTLEWVDAEQKKIERETVAVGQAIVKIEEKVFLSASDEASLAPQNSAFRTVQKLQSELFVIESNIQSLSLEIADSDLFILTLDRKIQALQDSSAVATVVSEVQYAACPSCFAPIASSNNPHACRLCKEPFDVARLRRRIVSQLNDMVIQAKQSRSLQVDRLKNLQALQAQSQATRLSWESARKELARVKSTPTSEARDELRLLNERFGYLKRELEGFAEKAALIGRLDEMTRQKAAISAEKAKLEELNERLKFSEQDRLAKAFTAVANETANFLRQDLPRQDSFQTASTVTFSFQKDSISVDGQSYFSASSTVYLKNAFLSAFLFCAATDPQFRHLRFLVLDTIEDKGMEPERSQNFQKLLVERSAEIEVEHQIIFATAMISPELDNDNYVVGRRSSNGERTLLLQ